MTEERQTDEDKRTQVERERECVLVLWSICALVYL